MAATGKRRLRNLPQRVVASVGSGVVLLSLAAGVVHEAALHTGGGWFNYAPNSGATFGPGPFDGSIWWTVGATVAAAVIWTGVSMWIFRPDRPVEVADRDRSAEG